MKKHRFPPRHHIARCRRWELFCCEKKPKAVPWGGETRTPNGNGGETAVGAELKIADTLVDADANEGKKHKKLGPF